MSDIKLQKIYLLWQFFEKKIINLMYYQGGPITRILRYGLAGYHHRFLTLPVFPRASCAMITIMIYHSKPKTLGFHHLQKN